VESRVAVPGASSAAAAGERPRSAHLADGEVSSPVRDEAGQSKSLLSGSASRSTSSKLTSAAVSSPRRGGGPATVGGVAQAELYQFLQMAQHLFKALVEFVKDFGDPHLSNGALATAHCFPGVHSWSVVLVWHMLD
jgi:hypothetical protein